MKKIILSFIFVILLGLTLSSCRHDYELYNPNYNNQEITENVQNIFGTTFAENHSWQTTINSKIKVNVNTNEYNIKKVQILLVDNNDSIVSIKLLNEAIVSNGDIISFVFDTPKKYTNLFVAFVTEENQYFYKKFNLGDTDIYFKDNNQARVMKRTSSNYQIPSITPIINNSISSFASQRNWIDNELLYTYNNEYVNVNDYDDDYKEIFRSIIFNYFPNGRSYNNLPKIKESRYYNESSYMLTVGDNPIIVSPVYKNDGGYREVSEADLYYYYFKGDLTVEELEALPKYRAIKLGDVFKNSDNDIIIKSKSYALAYFGDNATELNTEGSYIFPKGYKIGFMYRSNTTADNNKKQGELYCDGRLNHNINNWGNFKSSKLDSTDPRMAWLPINDKMFLCVESGTDRDFNDLIIEVEGNIKPFLIMPNEPEHQYYTFCFEDSRLGDYDMNDVVLRGTRLDNTHVEYTVMATGAMDELYIWNVEGNIINKYMEVHAIFGSHDYNFINTSIINVPFVSDTITVNENFSFLDSNYQPYIFDKTKNWYVKISKQGEDPHAIMIPYDFKWPKERVCIKDAYLRFNEWGENPINCTDWYKYYEIEKIVK